MKMGAPPTARKARTGEFTPPGSRRSARSSKRAEISSLMRRFYPSAARQRASEGMLPYIRRQRLTWNAKHFRVTLGRRESSARRRSAAAHFEVGPEAIGHDANVVASWTVALS